MIAFDIDGVRFHFRVGGIVVKDGKVLLNRGRGLDYWFIPGGRIDGGEDSASALRREMLEELGEEARVGRFLCAIENFFEDNGRRFHEMGIYYEMEAGASVARAEGRFIEDSGSEVEYRWIALEDIPVTELYPAVIKDVIIGKESAPHLLVKDA